MTRRLIPLALVLCLMPAGCGDTDEPAATTTTAANAGSGVTSVVRAAQAFSDSLDSDQKELALLELTQKNAVAWSNLPCGQSCRGGIPLGKLSADQKALADTLLKAALGTDATGGYGRVTAIRAADEQLDNLQDLGAGSGPVAGGGGTPPSGAPGGTPPSGAPGGAPPSGGGGGGGLGGYGADLYDLALLGDPGTDGTWMLHFGGHHLAVNFTYKDGAVAGPSPFFVGVEPTTFTTSGTTYTPLGDMAAAMKAVTGSLTGDQLTTAKLAKTYTDVLLGPGEDGQFPATKEGLPVSSLSAPQRKLVLAAMRPWVGIADDATGDALMADYEKQLDQTYVAYSGGTGLDAHGDYVRIDGPGVWIEFVCQNGVVINDKIHYHTIWRDHTRDYGGEFSS